MTFTNETASGWQQADFAAPIAITANTIYVASYHAPVGRYSADSGYFTASAFDRPPLHALRDGTSGGNGVYAYGSAPAFPNSTYAASNYWVDVVYTTSAGGSDTTPPTDPTGLTATANGSAGINLTWTASTDNVGVTGYLVERCQGAGCSTFAQIATPTGTTFGDTGLTAGTSYSYRVRARDAANNLSGYSATASATTTTAPDTTPPTAPTGLTATANGSTGINLTWTASTDAVGVTGYFVERCIGSTCSDFAQVGTPVVGTTFADTGLTASTTYRYRVRATDAANNLSNYSAIASATTTAAPDTTPPTVVSHVAGRGRDGLRPHRQHHGDFQRGDDGEHDQHDDDRASRCGQRAW